MVRKKVQLVEESDDGIPEPVHKGRGICQNLTAAMFSVLGVTILTLSFLVLTNDRLQIQNYMEPIKMYYLPFPNVLLGTTAATITASILQIVSSLMVLFGNIDVAIWRWCKFMIFMTNVVSLTILRDKHYGEISPERPYRVLLIINSIFCGIFLLLNVCCFRKPATVPDPY